MDAPELLVVGFAILVAVAIRVLDVAELFRRRPRRPYDPASRPSGKGW